MAKKEYELDKALPCPSPIPPAHIGFSYAYLDSCSNAEQYFISALKQAGKDNDLAMPTFYPSLLYHLSILKNATAAKQCLDRINIANPMPLTCFALAEYYKLVGHKDSTEYFCKEILGLHPELTDEYDAIKLLFVLNADKNPKAAINYAKRFVIVSDSLNLGKRQQLAATVNNQHKYYRDMAAEQKIKEENANYRFWITTGTFCFLIILLIGIIFYIYNKYRMSRIIIAKNEELMQMRASRQKMEEKIRETDAELAESRKSYQRISDDLLHINEKTLRLQNDLDAKNAEYEDLKKEVAERVKLATDLMHMLHQTELSASAEDTINNIRQASVGKYRMSSTDWSKLFKAVDKLYPDFSNHLVKHLTKFNEQQKQVIYLLRIGLTSTQIENITNLSHSTVWRWTGKYRDKLGDILSS